MIDPLEIINQSKEEAVAAANKILNSSNKRTFSTGATRDIDNGKLEYSNYIHPLNDYSFAEYMKSKQTIGGEYRKGDNWQKGLGKESLFESLIRHTEIIKLLYKGYRVIETKKDGSVDLIILKEGRELDPSEYDFYEEKNMENELNALRFNGQGLLLEYLIDKGYNRNII